MKSPFRLFLVVVQVLFVAATALASDSPAIVYLSADDTVPEGTEIREGQQVTTQSGMMVKMPDGSDVELDRNTSVTFTRVASSNGGRTELRLNRGAVRSRVTSAARSTTQRPFTVVTPIATAGVRGTDFSVTYDPAPANAVSADGASSEVDVFEGTVEVEQGSGGAAEQVAAGQGLSMSRRAIRRRAVQEKIRERWNERRSQIIEHLRRRMNLGENDDVGAALRERLRNMPESRREEIRERLNQMRRDFRERAQQRLQNRRNNAPSRPPRNR